jgi:hypothetical protein
MDSLGLATPYDTAVDNFQGHISQREKPHCDQCVRVEELEGAVGALQERLSEETQRREMLEFDRELVIDALREKSEDLNQRNETIDVQNALLSLAWADAQDLVSSQRSAQDALQLLREYIGCVTVTNGPDTALSPNKKRRRSP